MKKVNVTKTFMPPAEDYQKYLKQIWDNGQVTNQGPLLHEFEEQAKHYLGVQNFQFVANGTLALQLALNALDVTEGEVITTPFSYVATTSAILWERCTPVFVDIDPETLCIDPDKIEAAITNKTQAIMPVHVFGHPCDVEAIDTIAKNHNLKVIYDGAHAFGVEYKGKSLLSYGDISTCSFHATKPFHTIEGGCVITKDKTTSDKVELIKRFGHNGDEHFMLGINAKASEFQAAMGLCNLDHTDQIFAKSKMLSSVYDKLLGSSVRKPKINEDVRHNYAYYPVIFDSEKRLLEVMTKLESKNIFPRRYFFPSLNTLPYLGDTTRLPISEDVAKKTLCLPLYADLDERIIKVICEVIRA